MISLRAFVRWWCAVELGRLIRRADVWEDRLDRARRWEVAGLQRSRARRLERMRTRMPLPRDRLR